jgi:hypothetical protein
MGDGRMTTDRPRRLLLVVGIGRSGTSLFTGILGQLGWYVPQPEVQADDTNPRGFGEPKWVVDFHTSLQRASRVTNMDSRPDAFGLTGAAAGDGATVTKLRNWLSEQFSHGDSVVVKDPRVVWFLPLWQACAAELGVETSFATMLRYPTEVLTSARKWYGTWQSDASRAASWVNVMLHTEHLTRGAPRAFVRYEDLLTSWEPQISRIAAPLHAEWMADIDPQTRDAIGAFIDPTLRRSQVGWDDVAVPDPVRTMIDGVWEQLSELTAAGGERADSYARLDASLDAYRRFYREIEATAQSSIHAAKRHAAASRPAGGELARIRLVRRVPERVRRLVPIRLRRRILRSG